MVPDYERDIDQASQVLLRLQYQQLRLQQQTLPPFKDVEFRRYSQNGEDGILLYIFSMLGTVNRKVVEVCAGTGIECNAANLLINHGWQGLLVDGNETHVNDGNAFYAQHPNTRLSPAPVVHAWVTAENINQLILSRGFSGDIDLFSLDVDGVDYWIWRALGCIRPRVVVVEFNSLLGPERSLTLPYNAEYSVDLSKPGPYKCGASLTAFTRLAREKGYRLAGVQSLGFNAFFLRDDVGQSEFPARTPAECFAQVERLTSWNSSWLDLMLSDGSLPAKIAETLHSAAISVEGGEVSGR